MKYTFKENYLDHMIESGYRYENCPSKGDICEVVSEESKYGVEFVVLDNLTKPDTDLFYMPKSLLEDYVE